MSTKNQGTERRRVTCRYTGKATGEQVKCATCGPGSRLKKFACMHEERKGDIVTWVDCQSCPHYVVAGLKDEEQPGAVPVTRSVEIFEEPVFDPVKEIVSLPVVEKKTVAQERLVLICRLAPGDCLVLTAVIESLAACCPGRFHITTLTTSPAVFENNPHVAENLALHSGQDYKLPPESKVLDVNCPLLVEWNERPLHVLEAFTDFFRSSLKLPGLFLTVNRPKLYFSPEEVATRPLAWAKPYFDRPTRYWLVNSGVKADLRSKQWHGFQEVVDRMQGRVIFVQVGRTCDDHPRLRGALDMVGKTDLRQLVNMVRNAEGVLTGISFLMHAAAACSKPAVVVAGGIEGKSWNQYPEQVYLDTIGQLDCCKHGGCGRGAIVQPKEAPIDPRMNLGVCLRPLQTVPPVGACMGMIRPEQVAAAIEAYYAGGVLQAGMQVS